ncbi:MAG: hypothetical protein M3Z32_13525 [Acidobacteriota bacterium]|nr:hypothetical protein [Acidobacteriota bacterium]
MNRISLYKTLLLTAVVTAMSARASIILDATASVYQSGFSREVGYNSPFANGGTGFHLHDVISPCTLPGCVTYSLGNSGLMDTTGKATTSSESSQAAVTLNNYLAGTDPAKGTIVKR